MKIELSDLYCSIVCSSMCSIRSFILYSLRSLDYSSLLARYLWWLVSFACCFPDPSLRAIILPVSLSFDQVLVCSHQYRSGEQSKDFYYRLSSHCYASYMLKLTPIFSIMSLHQQYSVSDVMAFCKLSVCAFLVTSFSDVTLIAVS